MIRLKSGLIKWSNAHKEFATKSNIVFSATHDIAQLIPDAAVSTEIQVSNLLGFVLSFKGLENHFFRSLDCL